MSIMIDNSKRTAIACKLADTREVQNLLISNEEKLISACSDQNICDQLGSMLKDDQKNLAIAALSGVVGSAVTQASDKSDMSILNVIQMDHSKVNILLMQIENSNDPQKIEEFFGQIYRDLSIHSEAEEQIVYPAIQSFYSETEDLYEDQAVQELLFIDLA